MGYSKDGITIGPAKGLVSIDWAELWCYRDLFLVLTWRDLSVRYKQTAIGVVWAVFQPIITMVIFTFVFNRMAGITSGDGTPYQVFLYVGQLFWIYYSNTLTNASNSLVINSQLVQKVYFPRVILPATAATTGLVDFAIASVVLLGMMAYFRITPKALGILVLPVLILSVMLTAIGMGLFLAAINVKYRDVRYAVPFFIQTLMYVTPVIYPASMLDKHPIARGVMLWLNPISGVITNARAAILGNSPVQWSVMAISLGMSAVFLFAGLHYFRRTERYFADVA